MSNSIITILAAASILFSLSIQPYLPSWLHPMQPWLVFPMLLLTVSLRHAFYVALLTGWVASVYFYSAFPTQFVLIIPASCLISFVPVNSWHTHRIWLLTLVCVSIGTVAYLLLTYGVFSVYSLFVQEKSIEAFAQTNWSYFILSVFENVLLALLFYRLLHRIWPDQKERRNPLTGTHVFTT